METLQDLTEWYFDLNLYWKHTMTKRNVLYGNKEMYKKDILKRHSRLHLEKKKIATLILNMILVLVSRQMVGSEKIFSICV